MYNALTQNLNENQLDAVMHKDGPALIIAGPGSGKTRVITSRIAWLINNEKIPIQEIAALTFTNKAANEMKNRIFHMLDIPPIKFLPNIGTFHSFCAYLIRENHNILNLDKSFAIYDSYDQTAVIKRTLDELNLDTKLYKPRVVLSIISGAKSKIQNPETYQKNISTAYAKNIYEIYKIYQQKLIQSNALDFDDLLMKTFEMLNSNQEISNIYQSKYKYLLIDEFQDTNLIQYSIAKLIANKTNNIFVVGDPDQSIYSWRNADITNILNFKSDYNKSKIIYLNKNYRSSQNIIDASQSVISENATNYSRQITSVNEKGNLIISIESYDENEEAEIISREINSIISSDKIQLKDIAIMYRTNAQSRAFEHYLSSLQIPYQLVGGTRFYQRQEIKDIIAYLRLNLNLHDDTSLLRIINIPTRGIGKSTVDKIILYANQSNISVFDAATILSNINEDVEISKILSSGPKKNVKSFLNLITDINNKSKTFSVEEIITYIIDKTNYKNYLLGSLTNPEERLENIEELVSSINNFESENEEDKINLFLESVSLINDVDHLNDEQDKLTLITLHQSKGLEFDSVFLTGLEDGTLPHVLSFESDSEMEEERRLMYVGITRAKRRLYLSRVFKRGGWGKSEVKEPSRFLFDIPNELIVGHQVNINKEIKNQIIKKKETKIENNLPSLTAGDKVKHPHFGNGIIIQIEDSKDDFELTIAFDENKGIKKFLYTMSGIVKL
jgi:DNA helicase-2/ATP-dependent DNA helicase PcrA